MSSAIAQSALSFQDLYTSEVDLAYQVKILRISQCWSARELSFLAARPPGYISERENLVAGKSFTLYDIYHITRALNLPCSSMFLPSPRSYQKIKIQVVVVRQQHRIVHDFWQKLSGGRRQLFCRLYEYETTASYHNKEKETNLRNQLTRWIRRLINQGYFSEKYRLALDLYLLANRHFKTKVAPRLLEEAINCYLTTNTFPRLVRYRQKQVGYVYQWMTKPVKKPKHNLSHEPIKKSAS